MPGSSRKLLYSALPRTIESEKYLIVRTSCDVYEFSLSYLGSDGVADKLRVTQQFERVSERPRAKAAPMTSEARGAILRSKIRHATRVGFFKEIINMCTHVHDRIATVESNDNENSYTSHKRIDTDISTDI